MILQGEVEQISLMKNKSGDLEKPGMLEYLEEIIGTNKYIEAIENATSNLEKKVGERKTVQESVKAIKVSLEHMNDEKNMALAYANAFL